MKESNRVRIHSARSHLQMVPSSQTHSKTLEEWEKQFRVFQRLSTLNIANKIPRLATLIRVRITIQRHPGRHPGSWARRSGREVSKGRCPLVEVRLYFTWNHSETYLPSLLKHVCRTAAVHLGWDKTFCLKTQYEFVHLDNAVWNNKTFGDEKRNSLCVMSISDINIPSINFTNLIS